MQQAQMHRLGVGAHMYGCVDNACSMGHQSAGDRVAAAVVMHAHLVVQCVLLMPAAYVLMPLSANGPLCLVLVI